MTNPKPTPILFVAAEPLPQWDQEGSTIDLTGPDEVIDMVLVNYGIDIDWSTGDTAEQAIRGLSDRENFHSDDEIFDVLRAISSSAYALGVTDAKNGVDIIHRAAQAMYEIDKPLPDAMRHFNVDEMGELGAALEAQHRREYIVEIRPTLTGERVIKRYSDGDVYYVDTLAEDWVDGDPDYVDSDDDEAQRIFEDAMRRLDGDDE